MATALGLWMLTPWFRRGMRVARPVPGGRILWPALATVLVAWIGFLFWIDRTPAPSETDIAAVAPANAKDGDWLNYGNDQGGPSYSPLTQLTAANVAGLEPVRSEEHKSELQPLMRISYAVFCLKKNNTKKHTNKP